MDIIRPAQQTLICQENLIIHKLRKVNQQLEYFVIYSRQLCYSIFVIVIVILCILLYSLHCSSISSKKILLQFCICGIKNGVEKSNIFLGFGFKREFSLAVKKQTRYRNCTTVSKKDKNSYWHFCSSRIIGLAHSTRRLYGDCMMCNMMSLPTSYVQRVLWVTC